MFEGLRFRHWRTATDNDTGVVTLTLDRADAGVNAISREVLEELSEMLERLSFEPPRGVVIHSAKPRGFAVGADIHELAAMSDPDGVLGMLHRGQRVFQRLAELPCPTVAAIHGHCLGGGTELALACRVRIAANHPDTGIGLPEVNLGIHPGWGGTVRLPMLVGAPKALETMLTGRTLSAHAARGIGLIDALAPAGDLMARAAAAALHPPSRPLARRMLGWSSNTWAARQALAPVIRRQTAARARPEHYPAPFALIETWRRGGSSLHQRLEREAHSDARLALTPTCRNLIRLYFLRDRLKNLARGTRHGIERIHVVGAGVMGGDIAAWCALRGFSVSLQDREAALVEPALGRARALFARKLGTPERMQAAQARLVADVEGHAVGAADLVIEAIFENLEAKQALYRSIEPRMKADALLASNTSSIPLDQLRTAVTRADRFLGLHYFNPVAAMPLVEVVRHDTLAAASEARALALVKALDKLPLPVAGTPGFLVNRILMPYLIEAMRLYNEGVPGPVLDRAARHYGMPMGPIELADTVGLDVCASVGRELGPFLGLELPPGLDARIEAGQRGKKDGQGFYAWADGKPVKPEVAKDHAAAADLEDRLILPMLNEAVACLHDGVVDDADLIDAGAVFGTGFAPFRGGPVTAIRAAGADTLRARLESLAATHGERFRPRPGWDAAALRGGAQDTITPG
jgi:3-hydroxyacyl-CoA dehydrogenase/enoyl-CoA hydratase/3-hydroxybutyryl-CoA epimerase